MARAQQNENLARVEAAVRHLVENLDQNVTSETLADVAMVSRFYFHRVFSAVTRETVGEMSRRLRLERAAIELRTGARPITEIAFEAGYATHEAFLRAFRTAFGYTPSKFRKDLQYNGMLPTPNGLHFGDFDLAGLRFPPLKGEQLMKVEIRELPARTVLCMTHIGPYFMIGRTFGQLQAWLQTQDLQTTMGVAIYYSDPDTTPADQLKSDAGVFLVSEYGAIDPRVHVVELPAGPTHEGPYDGLGAAWNELCGTWLVNSDYVSGDGPSFEVYVNSCHDRPQDLRTEICISVAPAPKPALN